MAKKIRNCIVDATEYEYCPKCGKDNSTETWRMLYCCENCQSIYHVFDKYRAGSMSKDVAYSELQSLDLSKKNSFSPLVKPVIEEILGNGKKNIVVEDKIENKVEDVVKDVEDDEIKVENTDNVSFNTNNFSSRKKSKFAKKIAMSDEIVNED